MKISIKEKQSSFFLSHSFGSSSPHISAMSFFTSGVMSKPMLAEFSTTSLLQSNFLIAAFCLTMSSRTQHFYDKRKPA